MKTIASEVAFLFVVFFVLLFERSETKEAVIYSKSGEVNIEDGKIITTLSTLGDTHSIEFQIMVLSFNKIYSSMLALSQFNTESQKESVFLELTLMTANPMFPSDKFFFGLNLNYLSNEESQNTQFYFAKDFIKKWSKIKISQDKLDKKYLLTLKVNESTILKYELYELQHLMNITVYATKPSTLSGPVLGIIKDIEIKTVVAPCNCSFVDKDICIVLNKDGVESQGKCYSKKLLSDITYLDKTKKNLLITEKRMKQCQFKLRKLLPKFIDEYDECATNIHYHLKRLHSNLEIKLNELKKDYDYVHGLFGAN